MGAKRIGHFFAKGGSALDRIQQARVSWSCRRCGMTIYTNPGRGRRRQRCATCLSSNWLYHQSAIELKRWNDLRLLAAAGTITRLEHQPAFDLKVNGIHVTTYRADASYYENGRFVVEDTKPPNFMDDLAKLKIDLFNAVFAPQNVSVTLHRRGR